MPSPDQPSTPVNSSLQVGQVDGSSRARSPDHTPSKLILNNARHAVLDGHASLFLGAGFSIAATQRSWSALIEHLGETLAKANVMPTDWGRLTLLERAQVYQNSLGRCALEEAVVEAVRINRNFPGPLERAILSLPVKYIVTTNYDTLIEETLDQLGVPYIAITDEADLDAALLSVRDDSRRVVVKMHGDVDSRNIVLSSSDYHDYDKQHARMRTFVSGLLGGTRPIFYGFSFSDPNVNCILNCAKLPMATTKPAHGFWLTTNPLEASRAAARNNGIAVVDFESIAALQKEMSALANESHQRCCLNNNYATVLSSRDWASNPEEAAATAQLLTDMRSIDSRIIEDIVRRIEELSTAAPYLATVLPSPASNPTLKDPKIGDEALTLLNHALTCRAKGQIEVSERIFLDLGRILLNEERYQGARNALEVAVPKLDINSADGLLARRLLGKAYIMMNDPKRALRVMEGSICPHHMNPLEVDSPNEGLYLTKLYLLAINSLTGNWAAEGRNARAASYCLSKLEEVSPVLPALMRYIPQTNHELGQLTESLRALREIFTRMQTAHAKWDLNLTDGLAKALNAIEYRLEDLANDSTNFQTPTGPRQKAIDSEIHYADDISARDAIRQIAQFAPH